MAESFEMQGDLFCPEALFRAAFGKPLLAVFFFAFRGLRGWCQRLNYVIQRWHPQRFVVLILSCSVVHFGLVTMKRLAGATVSGKPGPTAIIHWNGFRQRVPLRKGQE